MIGGTGLSTWLLDSFFAFTALLMLALRRPVARWLGPQAAYLLWLIPAARWLVPPLALPDFMRLFAMRDSVAAADPVAQATTPTTLAPTIAASSFDLASALTGVWMGGALLLLAALLFHHHRIVRRLGRDATLLGNVGAVRLMESRHAQGPLATGLWKRIIFVPQSARAWPVDAQQMAVAHEVTHHRAGHLVHNFAAILLLCLNWFNPVAWIAARAFVFDQEADCDARTLERYRFDRAAYARMLVAATSGALFSAGLLSPRANLINKSVIVRRIRRIAMTEQTTNHRKLGYGLVALAGVALLPLTASLAQADPAPALTQTSENRITFLGDKGEPAYRRDVTHKGKTYKIYADHDISEGEARKTIEDSEQAQADAAVAMRQANVAMREANRAGADAQRAADEAGRASDDAGMEAYEAAREAADDAREAAQDATDTAGDVAQIRIDAEAIRRDALAQAAEATRTVQSIDLGKVRIIAARGQAQNADWDKLRADIAQAQREGRIAKIELRRAEPDRK